MRIATIVAAALFTSGALVAAESAQAAITRYELNIPRQSLDSALKDLAQQTGLQVGRFSDAVKGDAVVGPLNGSYSAEQALKMLLAPTTLTYRTLNDRAIIVLRPEDVVQQPPANTPNTRSMSGGREDVFSAAQSTPSVNSSSSNSSPQKPVQLEEVVVTAQKRAERLQDVPVPVTALMADTLTQTNQLRLKDYYTNIPGFSVTPRGVGALQTLSIRGITTGTSTNPTVGITVDGVPYGSSTGLGGGAAAPDIDPGDLIRVEVLRGPQGTLYGASSIGGLLQFVTVDPSTDHISGRVQVDGNGIHNGSEAGYGVRGSINIPLSDSLAIRASAFTRQDPGYIDNPVLHLDGVNEARVSGGRLSALWTPSELFSVKLSALYQDARMDGSSDVDVEPGLGDLQQSYLVGIGKGERKVQVYSAIAKAKLGTFELTSVSGYNINQFTDVFDYTYAFGSLTNKLFGVSGTPLTYDNQTKKFTQELRLVTPIVSRVDLLVGLFYTHEDTQYVDNLLAQEPTTTQIVGSWGNLSFPSTYQEYAAFTDLTFQVTNQFDIQLGGRASHIRETSSETDVGTAYDTLFLGQASPVSYPKAEATGSAFTYLFTPRYKFSPDLMLYARLASGYRAGGTNAAPGVPRQYDPDKTLNYELGFKGEFLEHRLSVDTSVYYIDWKDIQLQLSDPKTRQAYDANASRAKSEGVELSVSARPLTGLTLATWVTWDDAILTEGFPANSSAYGVAGNRLPNTTQFSGNFSVQQEFPLTADMTTFVGAAVSYVGDRLGIFESKATLQRGVLPAFAKTDVRAGINYEPWTFSLFVNNVADRRGVLSSGLATGENPASFVYLQPRTVGLSVTRTF